MPIIRQCEEYGLPEPEHMPLPPEEKVAELLKAPTPWSGPMKIAAGFPYDERCEECGGIAPHHHAECSHDDESSGHGGWHETPQVDEDDQ